MAAHARVCVFLPSPITKPKAKIRHRSWTKYQTPITGGAGKCKHCHMDHTKLPGPVDRHFGDYYLKVLLEANPQCLSNFKTELWSHLIRFCSWIYLFLMWWLWNDLYISRACITQYFLYEDNYFLGYSTGDYMVGTPLQYCTFLFIWILNLIVQ